MDTITIISIIVAFIIGAIIVYFAKGKGLSQADVEAKIKEGTNELSSELAHKNEELQILRKESEEQITAVRKQSEIDHKNYSEQICKLKDQLSSAMNGKIDDVLKDKLENADKLAQEVEKLKKRISKLEEDLEDAEDDISSEKKKVKAKETENGQLQDEISKRKKEISQLTEELESTKSKLASKLEELKLKMDSLTFVQEILTAQQTSDASVQQRYASVDKISNYINNELRDDLEQVNCGALKTEEFRSRFEHWSAASRKNWLDGKTTIAFVGEFSAGKTSIVNRILSQDDPEVPTLPVSTKATTAIPTYISGTPYATTYNFLSKDNILKNISEETFKMVSKEVLDQVGGVSSLIENFVMKYKNPNLEQMSILDTPGFNSNDPEDARHTLDVINECDALFWVFDVNAGTVNRSSIDLIRKNLKKPLYVVINKVDTKATSEVDKVENLIKGTLSKEGIKVEKYIRFSAKAPLTDIMTPINSVPKDNTQAGFLDYVLQIITKAHTDKKKELSNANKRYQNLEKKGTQLVDQYNSAQNQLWNECQEAYNLPKWTEHFFSKDRFEMNQYEGNRLRSLLEDIASTKMSQLADLFNERVSNAQEAQHAYEEVSLLKTQVNILDHSAQQLKKLIKMFESERTTMSRTSPTPSRISSPASPSSSMSESITPDKGESPRIGMTKGYQLTQAEVDKFEYAVGHGSDDPNSLSTFKTLAQKGHIESIYYLGLCHYLGIHTKEDNNAAYQHFKQAAEAGHVEASYRLGECYYHGYGTNPNYPMAIKFWTFAADQGNADSQNYLGNCYCNGVGVEEDDAKAFEFYSKAAEQNHGQAICNLGYCYFFGNGVGENKRMAFDLFVKSAELGVIYANNDVGNCYRYGHGVTINYKEAMNWYNKGAEGGNWNAMINLGEMYKDGQGVSQNTSQAIEWYKKAADDDCAEAMNRLGLIYENQSNNAAAKMWYKKSADKDFGYACYNLGLLLWNQYNDQAEARRYMKRAVQLGVEEAQEQLNNMN